MRLALATRSEDEVARAADALRPVAHARDVPLVVADHFRLAARLGLDGVHLTDGPARSAPPARRSAPTPSSAPSPAPRATTA